MELILGPSQKDWIERSTGVTIECPGMHKCPLDKLAEKLITLMGRRHDLKHYSNETPSPSWSKLSPQRRITVSGDREIKRSHFACTFLGLRAALRRKVFFFRFQNNSGRHMVFVII